MKDEGTSSTMYKFEVWYMVEMYRLLGCSSLYNDTGPWLISQLTTAITYIGHCKQYWVQRNFPSFHFIKCRDVISIKWLSALVSWSTLVDLFNWFCLSAFIPAYLSVRFGVWLYQPIWFVISHQCCGADRIRTPRGPMCFFPLDIALVPVSSHGASDILPCETVRVTFTWC